MDNRLSLLAVALALALLQIAGALRGAARTVPRLGLRLSSVAIPGSAQDVAPPVYGGNDPEENEDSDAALIRRIEAEVMAESGVRLEDLINPSKVVNLERELISLNAQLAACGVGDAEERVKLEEKLNKKQQTLAVEKRAVMRGWLKGLFVGQSVLAAVISFAMVYDLFPGTHLPLPIQVMGFWMWWLFIIPSLRARKPSNEEKEALNIAFLASPAVSLAMPAITKDVAIIWWVNLVTVVACYAFAYSKAAEAKSQGLEGDDQEPASSLPPIILKALKALDYGSGQERGQRK